MGEAVANSLSGIEEFVRLGSVVLAAMAGTDRAVPTGGSGLPRLPRTSPAPRAAAESHPAAGRETPAVSVGPSRQSAMEGAVQVPDSDGPKPARFAWHGGPRSPDAGGVWAEADLLVDNSTGALKHNDAYKQGIAAGTLPAVCHEHRFLFPPSSASRSTRPWTEPSGRMVPRPWDETAVATETRTATLAARNSPGRAPSGQHTRAIEVRREA